MSSGEIGGGTGRVKSGGGGGKHYSAFSKSQVIIDDFNELTSDSRYSLYLCFFIKVIRSCETLSGSSSSAFLAW